MVRREILEANEKSTILQNRRDIAHQNWFCMHFTSTSTCINFWANSIFWPPWTIPITGKVTPTKVGVHVYYINLYLHEIFEPILFLIPMNGKFGQIWRQAKGSKISKTEVALPIKIGSHAFNINLSLHNTFEPIRLFDPMDCPWFIR